MSCGIQTCILLHTASCVSLYDGVWPPCEVYIDICTECLLFMWKVWLYFLPLSITTFWIINQYIYIKICNQNDLLFFCFITTERSSLKEMTSTVETNDDKVMMYMSFPENMEV